MPGTQRSTEFRPSLAHVAIVEQLKVRFAEFDKTEA
jgi:hypothetical protein